VVDVASLALRHPEAAIRVRFGRKARLPATIRVPIRVPLTRERRNPSVNERDWYRIPDSNR
ncbi:MAG: hypothetical protein M3406_10370, partial [Chloroflexota bacterium]|nr:hypothetical protein [Chloroflexota bacterium]